MNNNLFENETFNTFYRIIEEMVEKKISKCRANEDISDYGEVISVTNSEDGTKTKSAIVKIIKNDIETNNIKNNTNEILYVGDKVRVTAIGGNWNNSYINLKCGL